MNFSPVIISNILYKSSIHASLRPMIYMAEATLMHRMCVLPFMIFIQYESWYCRPKPSHSKAEILYIPEQAYAQITCNYNKVVSIFSMEPCYYSVWIRIIISQLNLSHFRLVQVPLHNFPEHLTDKTRCLPSSSSLPVSKCYHIRFRSTCLGFWQDSSKIK